MAPEPQKIWWVLPELTYKPNDIRLGQIVKSHQEPYDRVAKPLPLPEALTPRKSTSKHAIRTSDDELGKIVAGIFSLVVDILKMEASRSKSARTRAHYLSQPGAVLETQCIGIGDDLSYYFDGTLKVEEVAQVLGRKRRLLRGYQTLHIVIGILQNCSAIWRGDYRRLRLGRGGRTQG